MTPSNAPAGEPTLFSAMITPHRSLGSTGFVVLMSAVAAISFFGGLFFFLIGAWPVVGFFALDVLLIWWAFRVNYRAAAAYEEITVTPSELRVRKVSHRGQVAEWTLNPLWVRLDRETDADYGLRRLSLVSRERQLTIASYLGPEEREDFAAALSAALGEARRGPTRTALPGTALP